jgi:hypothetical protein
VGSLDSLDIYQSPSSIRIIRSHWASSHSHYIYSSCAVEWNWWNQLLKLSLDLSSPRKGLKSVLCDRSCLHFPLSHLPHNNHDGPPPVILYSKSHQRPASIPSLTHSQWINDNCFFKLPKQSILFSFLPFFIHSYLYMHQLCRIIASCGNPIKSFRDQRCVRGYLKQLTIHFPHIISWEEDVYVQDYWSNRAFVVYLHVVSVVNWVKNMALKCANPLLVKRLFRRNVAVMRIYSCFCYCLACCGWIIFLRVIMLLVFVLGAKLVKKLLKDLQESSWGRLGGIHESIKCLS